MLVSVLLFLLTLIYVEWEARRDLVLVAKGVRVIYAKKRKYRVAYGLANLLLFSFLVDVDYIGVISYIIASFSLFWVVFNIRMGIGLGKGWWYLNNHATPDKWLYDKPPIMIGFLYLWLLVCPLYAYFWYLEFGFW
jgi:hypothetical protein